MNPVIVAPARIEPARIEGEIDSALAEAALDLARASERIGAGLSPTTLAQVAAIIRIINSHYSNRIEGNTTAPSKIEAALMEIFDDYPRRRALQKESAAHAVIKELTDNGILGSQKPQSVLQLHFPSRTHKMLFPRLFKG
jgi:Fic family protein